jgi:glycosyltransferase involved in cell wall biosynthesis
VIRTEVSKEGHFMKIALVAQQVSPLSAAPDANIADQNIQVTSLASALAKLGHRVTIFARKDSPALPGRASLAPRVGIEHVSAGPAGPLAADELAPHIAAFGGSLADRWRRNPPDIVHAHFWTSGLAALAGARDLGIPVVQTFHSLAAAQWPQGQRDGCPDARIRLEAAIARSVRAVVASSSAEMSALARLGISRTSVTMVPYGVDTRQFLPKGPVAKRNGQPRLLAVTPLAEGDGLATVVRSLAHLPDAELVIAGGPPQAQLRSDKMHGDITRLASGLRVADRITFTGRVGRKDMPALLRSADLLVNLSTREPFGMVPLEAMACGTPVVASAVGSHRDTVIDGTTGVLVPPGKPVLLAKRIRQLLASPMLLEGYGIAAVDRARSRYSWDRIGLETFAVYERVRQPAQAVRAHDVYEADDDYMADNAA